MSIQSKARRDARKRKLAKARTAARPPVSRIEPHAELRASDGRLLGGIVRRDGEWTLGLDGKIVGDSGSAAGVLALIRRAAALHERGGQAVSLNVSPILRAAADEELAARGLSFEQFEAEFEKEWTTGLRAPPADAQDSSGMLH